MNGIKQEDTQTERHVCVNAGSSCAERNVPCFTSYTEPNGSSQVLCKALM